MNTTFEPQPRDPRNSTASSTKFLVAAAVAMLGLATGIVVTDPSPAFAAPPVPVYFITLQDAVTGDNAAQNFSVPGVSCTGCRLPDPNGLVDNYTLDVWERPTQSGSSANVYFPALDITTGQVGYNSEWVYYRINLFGVDGSTNNLPYFYAFEINFDADAGADLFVRTEDPANKLGTTFGNQGVIAFYDQDNGWGASRKTQADGPGASGNGFEQLVFDQGTNNVAGAPGGSTAVQARIAPDRAASLEIAVWRPFLNSLSTLPFSKASFRPYAAKAGATTGNSSLPLHDNYDRRTAGSPFPWLASAGAPGSCPDNLAAENALTAAQRAALDSGTNTATANGNQCYPSGGNIVEADNAGTILHITGGSEIQFNVDMSITKTDSVDPVAPSSTYSYTLTATNNTTGAGTASGVRVTDTLPSGVTLVSATPSQGTCSGTTTVTCTLGQVANGASATVVLTVTAPAAATTVSNTATVSSNETDTNATNNSDTEPTTVASLNAPPVASDVSSPAVASSAGATAIPSLSASDADGTIVSYTVLSLPSAAHGVLLLGGSPIAAGAVLTPAEAAALQFDPTGTFTGNASFTFTATDDDGATDTTPATYTIPIANTPPTADDESASTPHATAVDLAVTVGDTDPDGTVDATTVDLDPMTAGIQTSVFVPGEGQWTVTAGVVTFAPEPGFSGIATLGYTVDDNLGATSNVATITVTVADPASIGGTVWLDIDGDGLLDGSEPDVTGVTVNLYLAGGSTPVATTTTVVGGAYLFEDLPAGAYDVEFVTALGALTLADQGGDDALDSDPDPVTNRAAVTVSAGDAIGDLDAGVVGTSTLEGMVWLDLNGDGNLDIGEPPLAGVTVTGTWAGPDDLPGTGDEQTFSVTTAADGSYSLLAVPAGAYSIATTAGVPADLVATTSAPLATTVAAGTTVSSLDVGYRGTAEIGDTVFFDADGDGIRDAGEPGYSGVAVTATWYGPDGTSGGGDDVVLTTDTAVDGTYGFSDLPAGDYDVAIAEPSGTTSPAPVLAVTLSGGATRDDVDFALAGLRTVGDLVWVDADGDGLRDMAEPGLPGVGVELTWLGADATAGTADDHSFPVQSTSADGGYSFSGLPPGDHIVSIVPSSLPADASATYDADGVGTADTATVTVLAGADRADIDFGYRGGASMAGRVVFDADADDAAGGADSPLAGLTVTATWFGPDGVPGGGDDIVFATVTATDGSYSFGGLFAGEYELALDPADLPPGLVSGFDPEGIDDGTAAVTLAADEARIGLDFGQIGVGSLEGTVFLDVDADATLGALEPGIATVDVELTWAGPDGSFGTADDAVLNVAAGLDGSYSFDNLPAGEYRVDPVSPPGYAATTDDPLAVALAVGEARSDVDHGLRGTASAGDRVWLDIDGDGVQDSGEPGLAGVEVTVVWFGPDATIGGGDDVAYPTVSTDASGDYLVPNLPPGTISVAVTTSSLPSGLTASYDLEGVATASLATLSLSEGEATTDADFGYQGTARLGDTVFFDLDGDGAQTAGEPGVAGVPVSLTYLGADGAPGGGDDVVFSDAVSDADGRYSFAGLPAGTFVVEVDAAGFVTTTGPVTVGLLAGETDLSADFGVIGTGSIGDTVFFDADGDGAQAVGEPGLVGVTVTATWAGPDAAFGTGDDVVSTSVTSTAGAYAFDGLATADVWPSGAYRIDADPSALAAGLAPSGDRDGAADATTDVALAAAAQVVTDADFAFAAAGTLSGTVWFEADGDGSFEALEAGLAEVTVTARWLGLDGVAGGGDDATFTATTDAAGGYAFTGLPNGQVVVTVGTGLPAGSEVTGDPDPSLDGSATVTISTIAISGIDFGYTGAGSIGDRVWVDVDRDGVQDADEPGLPGVSLVAVWAGPDGDPSTADDNATYVVVTGVDGGYLIDGVPAGDTEVTTTVPSGFELTVTDVGVVTLTPGQDLMTADVGLAGTSSISGVVQFDADGDQVGDVGLSGVDVFATWAGPDGDLATTADNVTFPAIATVAGGAYVVDGVPPGPVRVSVDETSLPGGLDPSFDDDLLADSTTVVTVPAATSVTGVDFGYEGTSSIADRVWFDSDGDGVQDAGEPGLVGVSVTAVWAGPDGDLASLSDNVSFSTITGANGAYVIAGVPAGSLRVTVATPAGMTGTFDVDGGNDATTIVVVPAATDLTTVDFGLAGAGTIGDRVWLDVDGDGIQDLGEPGLAGVDISVTWAGPDGDLATPSDNIELTTTTSSSGGYSVSGLADGPHQISVAVSSLPDGLTASYDLDATVDSTTSITLANATAATGVDFGYRGTASVGDVVFLDLDGDGVQDAGEPGLPGVVMSATWAGPDGDLAATADNVTFTTVSAPDGSYAITNLPAGAVAVSAGVPAGYSLTTAPIGTLDLTPAQVVTTADVGLVGTGSIGDRVWWDVDGDGAQDPDEPGLRDADVSAVWSGPDGAPLTADDLTFNVTAGPDGGYSIVALPPGSFTVTVTAPAAGLLPGFDADGGADGLSAVTLPAAGAATSTDFAFVGEQPIGDRVWFDTDGDGAQDVGEPGLAGVDLTVEWSGPDGDLATTGDNLAIIVSTGSNGIYSLMAPAGPIAVTVDVSTLPSGVVPTFDRDTTADGITIVVADASTATSVDFGFGGVHTVGDGVWLDIDGDGLKDAGEPGLAGVAVTVDWAGPDGDLSTVADNVTTTSVTDLAGTYNVSGLADGGHRVTITGGVPAGLAGSFDLDGGGDLTATLVLPAGGSASSVDFGLAGSASVGDLVWLDVDGDGGHDVGEPGVAGAIITVTWLGADGAVGGGDDVTFPAATSDADGAYLIDGLPAGTFTVVAVAPSGYVVTTPLPSPFVLSAGEARSDLDLGLDGSGSISGTAFFDPDRDASHDVGEPGVAAVALELTWAGADGAFGTADDLVYAALTGPDGTYTVPGLAPGEYDVALVGTGLTPTTPTTRMLTLDPAESAGDVDFGVVGTATVGDTVFFDADGDGVHDPGEPGLEGAVLTPTWAGPDGSFGTADDVVLPAVTALSGGTYAITGLPTADVWGSGLIRVAADPLAAGLTPSGDRDALADAITEVTLASSAMIVADADFAFEGSGAVDGRLWFEQDGDGVAEAGEPALGGVVVTATWLGLDGVPGGGDDVAFSTTTDSAGAYGFAALPDGAVRISVDPSTLPGGVEVSGDPDAALDGATVLVVAAGVAPDADFGYTGVNEVGDRVWFDLDGDGIAEAGEPGLPGVEVTVTSAGPDGDPSTLADNIVVTVTSAADGSYLVDGLPDGAVVVTVGIASLPEGMVTTFDADGGLDSTVALVLPESAASGTTVFGYTGTGALGDQVWLDLDADGIEDLTDRELAGVTVDLIWAGANSTLGDADDVEFSAQTVAGNSYAFDRLPAGTYQVTIDTTTLPPGLAATFDLDGGLDDTATLVLAAAQTRLDADFGYAGTGAIAATIFDDLDADGRPIGDPSLAAVPITITWAGIDGVFGTADDASFTAPSVSGAPTTFTNLPTGEYRVDADQSAVGARSLTTSGDPLNVAVVGGATATASFGFGVNAAPVATNDDSSTDQGVPVTIGVLGNDSDADGDQLTVTAVTVPSNGTVVINADGSLTYTPAPTFVGTDRFDYTVCDTGPLARCTTAAVTVVVAPANVAPQFDPTVSFDLTISMASRPGSITATDANGDPLRFRVASGTLPPGVTLNPDGSFDGSATTPGQYEAAIEVCDNRSPAACTTRVLSILVRATGLPVTGTNTPGLLRPASLTIVIGLLLLALSSQRRRRDFALRTVNDSPQP